MAKKLPTFEHKHSIQIYWSLPPSMRADVDKLCKQWIAARKAGKPEPTGIGGEPVAKAWTPFTDLLKASVASSSGPGGLPATPGGRGMPKPPGAGWQPIPGGTHGGFRRRKGDEWEYWYPGVGVTSKPQAPSKAVRRKPKFLMRKRNKAGKWEYHHKVQAKGKYIHEKEHFEEGAQIALTHEGAEGHVEIVKRDGDKLKVRHSTGAEYETTADELSSKIKEEHGAAIRGHKERLGEELEAVHEWGTEAMQQRLVEEAGLYGVVWDGGFKFTNEEPWEPPDSVAWTVHEQVQPDITGEAEKLGDQVLHFTNPKGKMQSLFEHQAEGVARIQKAWNEKGDGFLLMDEAGLGKTLTALGAIVANGGKRNLIVVPDNGKENLKSQWIGDEGGGLYGLEIKDFGEAADGAKGTFIASYSELYDTIVDPETGEETVKLKPEFEGKFDTIAFDESHNMANPKSNRAMAGVALQENADKVLYMSATPFTNITDMHYLRKLGTKDQGWFSNGKEFAEWAKKAGCRVDLEREGHGDIPVRLVNPNTPHAAVAVAALMNHQGVGVKREPDLTGLNAGFFKVEADKLPPKHKAMFEIGEQVYDLMVEGGIKPFNAGGTLNNWRKSAWEIAKTDHAIKAAKKELREGRQVLIFLERKTHDHAALKNVPEQLRAMADSGRVEDPQLARQKADEIEKLVAKLEDGDVIGRMVKSFERMLGEGSVAQVHGDSPEDAKDEQAAYQAGHKRVCIATVAKGGTGLSFHDNNGISPRTQINVSIPYAASQYVQVAGRSHRLGSESSTRMIWMHGDDKQETKNGQICSERLRSMGALTSGDPGSLTGTRGSAEDRANWASSYTPDVDIDEITEAIKADNLGTPPIGPEDEGYDPQSERGRKIFAWAVQKLREGGDPIAEMGLRLGKQRTQKQSRRERHAVAKLATRGIQTHANPNGTDFLIAGANKGTEGYEAFAKLKYGATYNEQTGIWSVHDTGVFPRVSSRMGFEDVGVTHEGQQVRGAKSWDDSHLGRIRKKYEHIQPHKAGEGPPIGEERKAAGVNIGVGTFERLLKGGPFVQIYRRGRRCRRNS